MMTAMEGTPSEVTPRRQRGGQPGNANALRHGIRAVRLNLGSQPAKLKRVERAVNEFRRLIEAAVIEAHGEIGVYQAALIQSACRHETHALLAARWLRLSGDTLKPEHRLAYSKSVADASTSRDKCLERLKIDATAADDLAAWYAAESSPVEHDDNTDAKEGDDGEADPGTT